MLTVVLHSVKMPVRFRSPWDGIKIKELPLSVMAHLKKSIIQGKAETNCLAHVLIKEIAKLTNDPDYKAYRQGWKIYPKVSHLLETTGIGLDSAGGIPELESFQDHFRQ